MYNMQIGALLARGQVPEQLSGWILCRQEAAGVHVLSQGLLSVYPERPLYDVPIEMDQEQKGTVYCQEQRKL